MHISIGQFIYGYIHMNMFDVVTCIPFTPGSIIYITQFLNYGCIFLFINFINQAKKYIK